MFSALFLSAQLLKLLRGSIHFIGKCLVFIPSKDTQSVFFHLFTRLFCEGKCSRFFFFFLLFSCLYFPCLRGETVWEYSFVFLFFPAALAMSGFASGAFSLWLIRGWSDCRTAEAVVPFKK